MFRFLFSPLIIGPLNTQNFALGEAPMIVYSSAKISAICGNLSS